MFVRTIVYDCFRCAIGAGPLSTPATTLKPATVPSRPVTSIRAFFVAHTHTAAEGRSSSARMERSWRACTSGMCPSSMSRRVWSPSACGATGAPGARKKLYVSMRACAIVRTACVAVVPSYLAGGFDGHVFERLVDRSACHWYHDPKVDYM